MQKVLIITYYWPPGSGAGVQRWLKFSKYLPSFGWEPLILTVDPGYATWPATDITLEKDIPADTRVYKTAATDYFRLYRKDKKNIPSAGFAAGGSDGFSGTLQRFIRGNFFIPDPRRGWNSYAFNKACELITDEKIDHIITTSPPHSTQLIGLKLKKKFPGIKWIADFRDPWTDIYYYSMFYPSVIARTIDSNYEKMVLRSADKIITVGKTLKDLLSSKVSTAADKTVVITNGFDEDDFNSIQPESPDLFTVSYIGTLSDDYPVSGFISAFRQLISMGRRMKLRFVGLVSEQRKNQICSEIGNSGVDFLPYADHHEAIKYMTGSSALLLIIPDHKSNRTILTGKLFEYIASGRPVICMGPADGDAAEIIKATSSGRVFNYDESAQIRDYLVHLLQYPKHESENITAFSRRKLTEKLVQAITG